jgi:predicted PurR-regulated permease PerM
VIAFGIVGLFIGPVTLAVTFTLLQAWIDEKVPSAAMKPTLKSTGDRPDGEPQ